MRTPHEAIVWSCVALASVAAHAAVFAAPPRALSPPKKRAPALVEVAVATPPPAATPPPPAAAPARKPTIKVAARATARTPPTPSAPPPTAAPPQEAPVDFTGVTLTQAGPGAGFATLTGNGEAMRGPVGPAGVRSPVAPTVPSGPPVVALGDLARPPEPPDLSDALERHYPSEARHRGVAGRATLRVRIMPDGGVRELRVLEESAAGFGEACRRALQASRWAPPTDRDGRSVSTYVHYTCGFEVR